MSDCIFCKIAAKELPAAIVHETSNVLAFRDINPKAPVHILIIPKPHISTVMDLGSGHAPLLAEMAQVIQAAAKLEKVAEVGFRLVVNNGRDAGMAVSHLHIHLLAGRALKWPPG